MSNHLNLSTSAEAAVERVSPLLAISVSEEEKRRGLTVIPVYSVASPLERAGRTEWWVATVVVVEGELLLFPLIRVEERDQVWCLPEE
jgi:hypothetical protein